MASPASPPATYRFFEAQYLTHIAIGVVASRDFTSGMCYLELHGSTTLAKFIRDAIIEELPFEYIKKRPRGKRFLRVRNWPEDVDDAGALIYHTVWVADAERSDCVDFVAVLAYQRLDETILSGVADTSQLGVPRSHLCQAMERYGGYGRENIKAVTALLPEHIQSTYTVLQNTSISDSARQYVYEHVRLAALPDNVLALLPFSRLRMLLSRQVDLGAFSYLVESMRPESLCFAEARYTDQVWRPLPTDVVPLWQERDLARYITVMSWLFVGDAERAKTLRRIEHLLTDRHADFLEATEFARLYDNLARSSGEVVVKVVEGDEQRASLLAMRWRALGKVARRILLSPWLFTLDASRLVSRQNVLLAERLKRQLQSLARCEFIAATQPDYSNALSMISENRKQGNEHVLVIAPGENLHAHLVDCGVPSVISLRRLIERHKPPSDTFYSTLIVDQAHRVTLQQWVQLAHYTWMRPERKPHTVTLIAIGQDDVSSCALGRLFTTLYASVSSGRLARLDKCEMLTRHWNEMNLHVQQHVHTDLLVSLDQSLCVAMSALRDELRDAQCMALSASPALTVHISNDVNTLLASLVAELAQREHSERAQREASKLPVVKFTANYHVLARTRTQAATLRQALQPNASRSINLSQRFFSPYLDTVFGITQLLKAQSSRYFYDQLLRPAALANYTVGDRTKSFCSDVSSVIGKEHAIIHRHCCARDDNGVVASSGEHALWCGDVLALGESPITASRTVVFVLDATTQRRDILSAAARALERFYVVGEASQLEGALARQWRSESETSTWLMASLL